LTVPLPILPLDIGAWKPSHAAERKCTEEKTLSGELAAYASAFAPHLKLASAHELLGALSASIKGSRAKRPNEPPFGTKLAVDVLQEECRRNGCEPLFVYIPNSEFWRPDSRAGESKRLLENYVASKGMTLLDTTDGLKALGDAAYSPAGPHLSPDGNRVVAEQIARFLGKR
jgi:hypothetical protein